MMTRTRPLLLACLILPLAGCGSMLKTKCATPADYAAVVDNPALKVPEGQTGPDTRRALAIPALNEPEPARPADQPCLDIPPAFTPAPAKPAAPKPPAT